MRKHSAELKDLIARKQGLYDIICIQESFLKQESKFSIPGYVAIRRDRLNAEKGGLVTLVKHNIKYTKLDDINDIEALSIKIKTSTSNVIISNVYIAPSFAIDKDKLSPLFITPHNIITGDLNAKSSLWGSPIGNHKGFVIESLLEEKNYVVLNTGKPTYQQFRGGMSYIYLTLVNSNIAAKYNCSVLNNTMGSDHCSMVINIQRASIQRGDRHSTLESRARRLADV